MWSLPETMDSLVEHFETNYIGRPVGRYHLRREQPFVIGLWNQYHRAIDGQDRTNNYTKLGTTSSR